MYKEKQNSMRSEWSTICLAQNEIRNIQNNLIGLTVRVLKNSYQPREKKKMLLVTYYNLTQNNMEAKQKFMHV